MSPTNASKGFRFVAIVSDQTYFHFSLIFLRLFPSIVKSILASEKFVPSYLINFREGTKRSKKGERKVSVGVTKKLYFHLYFANFLQGQLDFLFQQNYGSPGSSKSTSPPPGGPYPPNHPLSGSKHFCSICGDRASGIGT